MSKAKSMNSIGYWKISKIKKSFIFMLKKIIHRFYSYCIKKLNEIPFTKKILWELFKKIFISILVVLIFYFIDNNVKLFKELKFNNVLLSDTLIAGVSISGIFLGLFFANMSTVYSSRYANAPASVRTLFENDLITNASVKSIIQYIILTLTILVFNFTRNTPGIITAAVIILYTIKIIISFALIGKRMYQFSDTYEITSSIYNKLHRHFSNVSNKRLFKKDINFQNHYQKRCTELIKILAEVNDFNFEEDQIRSSSVLNFIINNIQIICVYWETKNKILYDSYWFKDKYIYKKWSLTDDHEITTALATGTSLERNIEKDYYWLEDSIFTINEKCLNKIIKDENYTVLISYMDFLSKIVSFSIKSFSVEYFINQIIKIETLIKDLDSTDKFKDEFAALVDILTLIYVNFGVSLNEYFNNVNIEQLINESTLIKSYHQIPFERYPFLNNKQMQRFFDGLESEIQIENKRTTPDWFIKQMVAQNYYNKLNEFAKYIDYIHNEKLMDLGKSLIEKENYFAAMIVLSRITEIKSKFEISINYLKKAFEQLEKWHIEKSYTWLENPIDKIKKNCFQTSIKLPELWVKATTALTLLDKEKMKDCPDFLGYSYNNLCELAISAIEDNSFELFEKAYTNLLPFSLLYQEETRKTLLEISSGNVKDAHLKVYLSPLIEYFDISGYAILWGELFSDVRWKEFVERKLKEHLEKLPQQEDIISKFISAIKGAESVSYGMYNRDMLHTQWQIRIYSRIKESNIIEYEYSSFYHKNLKTDNKFLKAYLGHDLDYSFNHAYEIYAVLCLNKYAKADSFYVSRGKWENKLKEGDEDYV